MIEGSFIRATLGIKDDLPFLSQQRKYMLAYVSLTHAGCPVEVIKDSRLQKYNQNPHMPIVIERNRKKLGGCATGYAPDTIVVTGVIHRSKLLQAGTVRSWAWIEQGVTLERPEDALHVDELLCRLQKALHEHRGQAAPDAMPWIVCLYPFEGSFLFRQRGQLYRQGYVLSSREHTVALLGQLQAMPASFISASQERDILLYFVSCWEELPVAVAHYLQDVRVKKYEPLPHAGPYEHKKIRYTDFALWSIHKQLRRAA